MKKTLILIFIFTLLTSGCGAKEQPAEIAATTLPVWEFTVLLCEGTGLCVDRLVTENVSCLHDYSLNVSQVKAVEAAQVVVISGAGLEDLLFDGLGTVNTIDASENIELLCPDGNDHDHSHDHGHSHDSDPHIWLSPKNAVIMAQNICAGLCREFPEHADTFQENLTVLVKQLHELDAYAQKELAELSCREIITFHDGFAYFAESCALTVLEAIEEESGSEASARELKHLISLVREHQLQAVFIEVNGSVSAAEVIARETGAKIYALDMAMSGESYFDAMYNNIRIIKEALE